MNVRLPKKCFISHAYADARACDRLIASLPSGIDARIFPPITVSPDQFVSNQLIQSLIECDGLIYLKGGASARSFWVAFERDYALRAGKQVFSADVDTCELARHSGGPLDLATFASYHRQDLPRVREIANFLKDERHFDLWLDVEDLQVGARWEETIRSSLEDQLHRGGYVVVFWSRAAHSSQWVQAEIQRAAEGVADLNDRVLFALLEDVAVPEFWLRFHEPAVQLYGDKEWSATHRLDDLVVRLYWLIFRKTEYGHLEEGTAGGRLK
jgi:TIR domain